MNVYDFDNTILRGDSTARFYAYCFTRYPRLWLDIPSQAVNALLFVLKIRKKQDFKQRMLSFLNRFEDIDPVIEKFWEKNFCRVKKFYYETRKEDDVVISASPRFLILPACEKLGVKCTMGSPVDKKTGVFSGPNCHGKEKVRRFYEVFPEGRIETFYSDSYSDDPLAQIAGKAVLVKGDQLLPWAKK